MKRHLPQARSAAPPMEAPTIMDRGLAASYGSQYVQLCAFAIDVDRVYVLDPDAAELAFGWEVFLTACYLTARVDARDPDQHLLLEHTCLAILEQPPDDQGYGSQLLFAVHDAMERGCYPITLRPIFASWSSRPRQLRKALDALWKDAERQLASYAAHCLAPGVSRELSPALSPSTCLALTRMRAGDWLKAVR